MRFQICSPNTAKANSTYIFSGRYTEGNYEIFCINDIILYHVSVNFNRQLAPAQTRVYNSHMYAVGDAHTHAPFEN